MIISENLGNGLIRTYSNKGVKIHGGYPESDYDIVYDPEDSNREYTETNIPVDEVKDLSRVKLYREFKKLGIWDQVKSWMQSNPDGAWEEWEYSTTLEIDNKLVQDAIMVLKSSFGFSEDDINTLINNCLA